jgi:uncharacterized membrane protein
VTRTSLAAASLLVVLTLVAAGIATALAIPADMQLPVHWGLSGEPDRFAGKWAALLMPAGIVALVSLLFWALPFIEPRREGLERSRGLYLWGWVSVLFVGAVIELAVVSEALGWKLPVYRLIGGAVGAMLAVIGNQLGKSRSMYLIGLRTPWTLASEEVWIRTHRLGGKLMMAAGVIIVAAAALAVPPEAMMIVMLAVVAAAAAIPVVYSYLLWRREAAGQASE